MNRGDTNGAESDLIVLADNPALAAAGPRMEFGVHTALAYCQQGNHEFESAYENAKAAGELDPAARGRDYWYLLMNVARATHRNYVATESLIEVLLSDPKHANDVDVAEIWSAYDATAEMNDGGIHRRLLLETLWQVKYVPKDAFEVPSTQQWWTDLFEAYADIGDEGNASVVLAAIRDPFQIVRLRADNRYRRFVVHDSRFVDMDAMSRLYVEWLSVQMDTHSRQIGAVEEVARALMMSNRLPEALQLLDSALTKVASAPKAQPAFDDLPDNLRWTMDTRARVLARLGRWDAVLDAQHAALNDAPLPVNDVVSQRINFGDYLYRLNRPLDALEQVKNVSTSNASAYGMLEAGEVRACAWAQLGNRKALQAAIAAMQAQRNLDPDAIRSALLCADDRVQLEQVIVARLQDSRTRNAELAADQVYMVTPNPTPYDLLLSRRLQQVLANPHVRATIAQYGVVESYPLFAPDH
ncbi:hypothetical protein WJ22_12635 [Burkholderia vietnamiensis]|nr:hypothetical protein WJ05_08510 [Burkholderia vietnamiensis]KVF28245.1 hypothetical protein WJ08_24020 [Burkholderia vietnamiensis]KVF43297.1 hypothetical protein WJ10_10875 [Burkholderia vietnamiensis]KVF87979.1 hypothetical protein WJ19_08935 [Burkholderia vietnamiensis]KVF88174.1 hypothetical protein WJ20_20090 [Burkholderia vietnamiensis]